MDDYFVKGIALFFVFFCLSGAYLFTRRKPKMYTCHKCGLKYEAKKKHCPLCRTRIREEIGVYQEGGGAY